MTYEVQISTILKVKTERLVELRDSLRCFTNHFSVFRDEFSQWIDGEIARRGTPGAEPSMMRFESNEPAQWLEGVYMLSRQDPSDAFLDELFQRVILNVAVRLSNPELYMEES